MFTSCYSCEISYTNHNDFIVPVCLWWISLPMTRTVTYHILTTMISLFLYVCSGFPYQWQGDGFVLKLILLAVKKTLVTTWIISARSWWVFDFKSTQSWMPCVKFDVVTCKHGQGCELCVGVSPSLECALSSQGFCCTYYELIKGQGIKFWRGFRLTRTMML